jgi:hypothetical protein
MNERDKFINDLVASEQAHRTYARDCVEFERYCEGRDKVVPYVPPIREIEPVDTGALKPAQIRSLKMFAFSGSFITAWVGFLGVCASGAMNTVFQYGAGGLLLVGCVSALFSGGGSHSSGCSTKHEHHHHYHQNNNFGGSGGANQNNY